MTAPRSPYSVAGSRSLAWLSAIAAIGVGTGVLLGWALDIEVFRSGWPGLRATQPITAVAAILAGISVLCAASTRRRDQLAGKVFAISIVGLAAPLLAQNVTGVNWRWDLLLFPEAVANQVPQPRKAGHMSDIVALIFILHGLAILIARSTRPTLQAAFVALATVGLILIASSVVGLLFLRPAIDTATLNFRMSVPTTLSLCALVFGALCLRRDLGWMKLLAGNTPAAHEMRSLAVGVIALPFVFAAVLQFGLHKQLYGAELRTALMVLGSAIVLFIALLMTAGRLKRIDEERQRSNDARLRVESELSIALDAMGMTSLRRDLAQGIAGIFGRAEPTSRPLERLHAQDEEFVERYLQTQLERSAPHYQVQYRVCDEQGQARWILEKGEIRYVDGKPSELAGVKLDVTETVQAREALRESEDRFRRIAEAMPQIVFVTGAEGNVEYINQRWQQYTGRPTATQADYKQLMPEEDLRALEAQWKHAHTSGESFAVEFRLRRADGMTRWFLARAVPVRDVNGEIVRWCGTSTDIDAQKRASEELTLVTDHAEVLLAHCDAHARYVFVNKAYTRRFNLTLEDVLGKSLPQVLGVSAYERIAPYVKTVLSGQAVDFEIEIPYEKLGSRYMYCRYVPDIDETSGDVRGFVAAITDVSDRRALEEQLREADRRKDEFLALLAHELRNPLAPIRYATGLLKPGVPPEISSAARDVIDRQVGHMARLLDDLLDVSRVTRDALELRCERIDLRTVVTETVNTLRPLFESVNHRLTMNLSAEAAPVIGDATRLAQVLSNILNNAAKYTDPGGQIEVQVGFEQARYVLRVIDSGAGIAPDFLPSIFEMFVQGDRRLTRASGGLGVGLALAKRVVEMHGGSIEAFSEGLGRGSTFTVRLPAAPAVAPAEPRAVAENVLPIFQRRHQLLIVDDNLDAANSLAILTQLAGYVTHLAADGLAAIEMAELVRPEAIVMDLGMPRMSGFEAARWVRQQPWGKDTVLIAVTGWGQDEDRRRSREAGFDVHLTKPVDSAELLKQLQRLTAELNGSQSDGAQSGQTSA